MKTANPSNEKLEIHDWSTHKPSEKFLPGKTHNFPHFTLLSAEHEMMVVKRTASNESHKYYGKDGEIVDNFLSVPLTYDSSCTLTLKEPTKSLKFGYHSGSSIGAANTRIAAFNSKGDRIFRDSYMHSSTHWVSIGSSTDIARVEFSYLEIPEYAGSTAFFCLDNIGPFKVTG